MYKTPKHSSVHISWNIIPYANCTRPGGLLYTNLVSRTLICLRDRLSRRRRKICLLISAVLFRSINCRKTLGLHLNRGMEYALRSNPVTKFTHDQLKFATNGLSDGNFIGNTLFGKLYRAKFPMSSDQLEAQATVKIWEIPEHCKRTLRNLNTKFKNEVLFLQYHNHSNLVKMIGYCETDELLATVYDLDPLDTLHNLIDKDHLNWKQTINIALQFARLLENLHSDDLQYLVRNISAAHIMIDKDWNAVLFDLSMITGGLLGDVPNGSIWGSPGYIDPYLISKGKLLGATSPWSVKCDVYSYGALLLGLIGKKTYDQQNREETKAECWAKKEFRPGCSLVHEKLQEDQLYDAPDGTDITALGLCCIEFNPQERPSMMQVVKFLERRHQKLGDAPM